MAAEQDDEDTEFAEEFTARALSEIEHAYSEAMALLAVISHDWETSAAQTLEPRPASPRGPRAVSVPVVSHAA